MPSFQYKAKQKDAKTVSGRIIAENRDDAVEKINQMGLVPVQVEEIRASHMQISGRRLGHVRPQTLYHFSRQLGNLLKGGIPILRALEIVSVQQKNPHYRYLLESLHASIREGRSFSDGLQDYPQMFPTFYIAMIKAGEESGRLKEVMADLADYLKSRGEIAARVQNAFVYPAFMALLGTGSVAFILTYVLPKLSVLYKQFGQGLPQPTVIVMKLSDWAVHGWAWALIAVLSGTGLIKMAARSEAMRLRFARLVLRLPGLGVFFLKLEMMRFCRALALMLKSGVSIVRAVQMAIEVVSNDLLRRELGRSREQMVAGRSFGESLREVPSLPDTVGYLIAVGEESGNMPGALEDIYEIYRQETDETLKMMTTLLEPLLIVAVGAVIGGIVIAMLLPIFQLDMIVS